LLVRLSLIVAMTRAGIIGKDGGLPWHLSSDLKRFKSLTMKHHIIMGRKTFESLGRVLPGRTTIVVSRQSNFAAPAEVIVVQDLDNAIAIAASDPEPFIIGGGQLFEPAITLANRLYVTWVEADIAGDTYFPPIEWSDWREITREAHPADAKNDYDTTFCVYDRLAL